MPSRRSCGRTRFVLTTHVNPDGDGIGSEVALAAWLRERGRRYRSSTHSPTPAVYRFLDPGGLHRPLRTCPPRCPHRGGRVIVVLDTNHPDRLQAMQEPVLGQQRREDLHRPPPRARARSPTTTSSTMTRRPPERSSTGSCNALDGTPPLTRHRSGILLRDHDGHRILPLSAS